jgi:diaminopimelate epimerase
MHFVKYQGTGNDFIILDGRNGIPSDLRVQYLCDRRFGIGADGLMILQNHSQLDFEMVYYNSDGNLSSMCGNGGRCLAHFANSLGIGKNGVMDFMAVDGPHHAVIEGDDVKLGMKNVNQWEDRGDGIFVLDTGSPHYVRFMEQNIDETDLLDYARSIRYNTEFEKQGINVNIVNITGPNSISMRTYERGVEDETLSCGTGVTASAIAFQLYQNSTIEQVAVQTPGGDLLVYSEKQNEEFRNIVLAVPAIAVFEGDI